MENENNKQVDIVDKIQYHLNCINKLFTKEWHTLNKTISSNEATEDEKILAQNWIEVLKEICERLGHWYLKRVDAGDDSSMQYGWKCSRCGKEGLENLEFKGVTEKEFNDDIF